MQKIKVKKVRILVTLTGLCMGWVICNTCHLFRSQPVTFAEHIAPIIYKHCTPCHRPGEAGPFHFLTYEDVKERASMIRTVTEKRYMPSWPADPSYSRFANERLLTDEEIMLIQKWHEQGAPLGDPNKIPPLPQYPTGSQIGKPDLVIQMEPVRIKGNNEDLFLIGKVPYQIERDTFIRFIEFIPGTRHLVHHMNANLIVYEDDKKKNVFGGLRYVGSEEYKDIREVHRLLDLLNDDGTYPLLIPMVCNYLPGVTYTPYPQGIGGYRMKRKGVFYLLDLHYGPSSTDTVDQSYFNIFFADKPPQRPTQEIILGTLGISEIVPPLVIPPDTVMRFHTQATVHQDISILTINPHMHLLGKSFLAYAVTPWDDTIPLIRIPKWDFRWQYFYTFKKMVKIPAGSTIYVEGVYDNTANNPNNPFTPPRTVSERAGSMRSSDEMLQFIITYVPYRTGDEHISLETTPVR